MYHGKKILIVDDSPTERHLLKEMVNQLGFTIFQATNGEEGIKMAHECQPNLILMDVVMPGLNGFQATREISKNDQLKNIPVIICTTKNAETDRLLGRRQGAAAYLVKPIKKDDLLTTIHNCLKL